MADLGITASEVQQGTGAVVRRYIAAAATTAGQSVYLDGSGQANLADADASDTAAAQGIAVNGADAGQEVAVQEAGQIDLGASAGAASGVAYVVSGTAGGIAPISDLGSGDYTTVIGVGTGGGIVKMGKTIGGQIA